MLKQQLDKERHHQHDLTGHSVPVFGILWCSVKHCWLAIAVWFGYCLLSFEFFVLCHLVIAPSATPREFFFSVLIHDACHGYSVLLRTILMEHWVSKPRPFLKLFLKKHKFRSDFSMAQEQSGHLLQSSPGNTAQILVTINVLPTFIYGI